MEKKVYNLKQSSLGKVTFLNGTCFVRINLIKSDGRKVNEIVIVPSIKEVIEIFPKLFSETIQKNIEDSENFKIKMTNYLINNFSEEELKKIQTDLIQKYDISNFSNFEPIKWINSDFKIVGFILIYLTITQNKGHLKISEEFSNLEMMVKFVKSVLAVNFWEEGNPKNNNPIKK